MTTPLRVLLVDDSEPDAEIIVRHLQREGQPIERLRVEDDMSMRAALLSERWDAVLCDWTLPCFAAPKALTLLRDLGLDLPFIIVSGTVGEEGAVAAMRAGAHDYVRKDNLGRLGPALAREIQEARDRADRRHLQQRLHAAQKLEAVGRLAAGLAHEMNTPIQFVTDSVQFLREATAELFELIARYKTLQQSVLDGEPSIDAAIRARGAEEHADLPFLAEEVPRAVARSLEGLERVAGIVRSMTEFARPGEQEMRPLDLNDAIKHVLVVARSAYARVADVETDLGDLPLLPCYAADVNDALLSVVLDAARAIRARQRDTARTGRISIQTRRKDATILIIVRDIGLGETGQPPDGTSRPAFAAEITGNPLSEDLSAASAVIQRHGGVLSVKSDGAAGTTRVIWLPAA